MIVGILLILVTSLFSIIPTVHAADFPTVSLQNVKDFSNSTPCLIYSPVTISMQGVTIQRLTCETEVSKIFLELGISPEEYEVEKDQLVQGVRRITAVHVTKERVLSWQTINYSTDITYTKDLPHRKKVIDKKGIKGLRGIVTEKITYPNGKVKTKVVEKWMEKDSVTEIARVGNKYDLMQTTINGVKVSYWRTLEVKATSYDSTCYGCNHTTATGAYLTKGIVAVDPKVIPMHTSMYIPGYGFGKAEDTGGMIKGNRIDLAYDDIRYGDWSKRWVTIYIID